VFGAVQDATTSYSTTLSGVTPTLEFRCLILVLRRATGILTSYLYAPTGLIDQQTVDASALGTLTNANGASILSNIPGTVNAFAWNVGESIAPTDTQIAQIAAYMLDKAPLPSGTVYLTAPSGAYLTAPSGAFLTRR
jgi:hypothetical protein